MNYDNNEEEFKPYNYIRVVNVRGDEDFQATEDEKIIIGHRDNPILGNRHVMKTKSMSERDRVIKAYKEDLKNDLAIQGPMWKMLQSIAKDIVESKQKVALQCFCAPVSCHLDSLVPVITKMAEDLIKIKTIPVKYINKDAFNLLILNPSKEDITDLKIQFKEENINLVCLAQVKCRGDDNDYDSFVFYEKENQSYVFHEFENPQHCSYYTNTKKMNFNEFIKELNELDKNSGFFKMAFISNEFIKMSELFKDSNNTLNKKITKI